ncbi:MAG: hypothetical protein EOO92_01430 [Pedobacter sp.]|nr:MAG: hypothetical protein EOO92_01430 [Pedobacter sp.]
MKYIFKFQFVLLFCFLVNLSAFAQYDASATLSLGMGHGYNALSQSVMSNAFANTAKGTSKASNADYVYLGSSNYDRFEQKILNQMVQKNTKIDKNKMRSFLSSSRTMHHFGTRARAYGLKETYISDLLATGIAWNWELYHQTKPSNQKVVNLRNSIRSNMAKATVNNQLSKLSDEEKREWILAFMYNNSMLAQTIKNTGKITIIQKQQLANIAKEAGVSDIAAVSLR